MTTTRKSNLELLRIIGILMIVMMHFCGQGGFSAANNPAVAFLGSAGRLSVNIFLLIGCWFMVDALRLRLEPHYLRMPPVQWLIRRISQAPASCRRTGPTCRCSRP